MFLASDTGKSNLSIDRMDEIGRDLIAVKAMLGHGNFLPWIEAEFGMSDKTAEKLMNAARHLGEKFELSSNFSPSVLYALAAPSTPEPVREAAIEQVTSRRCGASRSRSAAIDPR